MIKIFQKINNFFDEGSVLANILFWGLPIITFGAGLTLAMVGLPLYSIIPFSLFLVFLIVGILLNQLGKTK